jgi:hypothetical protein
MVWMVFPWHKKDFSPCPDEERVRSALKGSSPGLYSVPHCVDQKSMATPEMQQKYQDGPIAFVTVMASGTPKMGGKLLGSFLYNVLVGILCAYLVTRTLSTDAAYLQVFRVAGTVAFIAYGIAYIQDSIWFGRPVSLTAKSLLDALLYGLVTGGAFGWLV